MRLPWRSHQPVRSSARWAPPLRGELPPDASALLCVLGRHGVDHVLVGELAASANGEQRAWWDDTVAICPSRYARNLDRLATALRALHAEARIAGPSLASSPLTADRLRHMRVLRLRSEHGDLDIDFEPPATAGYIDLFDNARSFTIAGETVVDVAAPEDLVRIAQGAADSMPAKAPTL